MKRILLSLVLFALAILPVSAAGPKQEGPLRFDSLVHDFGTVSLSDGELECCFTATNTGDSDAVIYAVMTSCGCTRVEWTRETIAPGETGFVKATYANDEGPYPFDKVLTVYIKDLPKPVLLHLRGVVTKKK